MTSKPHTEEAAELEVAVEIGDGWTRRLTITVAPERVARERAAERQRVARGVRIKGFRKGKVPVAIVEQRYGELIDERVRSSLVEEAYREAIEQQDLHPAGAASISNVQYSPGERLTFQAEVEIVPRIELARVGGFRLSRSVEPVTEEEVSEILNRIREEHSTWVPVDRAPETGDRVGVRIQPVSDESETAGEARAYRLVLGGGQALPDVERAIMTLSPGEEGEFLVDFPAEGEPEGVGAEPVRRKLHISLEEVEARVLPELDDELATKAGEFETRADLERAIREDLERHHEEEAENRLRRELMDSLIEANPFAVPKSLVDRYLTQMIRAPEGADPEEVRKARESLAPHAEREIREQLILDYLIEREGLEATEEEIEAEIERLSSRNKLAPAELRRRLRREGRLDRIGRNLAVEKVFDYLKSQSSID